jgi:hypothetical protein
MADLREHAITLLASITAGMQNGDDPTTLYTVPVGKVLRVTMLIVRDPTASLADGTDFDFGDSDGGNYFEETVDLSGMTTVGTDYYIVRNDGAVLSEFAAGVDFEVVVNTGATADAEATIDVFGYLTE